MNQNPPDNLLTKQNASAALAAPSRQSSHDRFDKLLAFLQRLGDANISHQLADYREGAVSVIVRTPAEYWEVDFLDDGGVDIERFRTNGHMDDEAALDELFAQCSDEEAPASHDDAAART